MPFGIVVWTLLNDLLRQTRGGIVSSKIDWAANPSQ